MLINKNLMFEMELCQTTKRLDTHMTHLSMLRDGQYFDQKISYHGMTKITNDAELPNK